MERSKAIELLKNAVPAKALPDDEIGFFIEAVSMAIKSLEQAHFVSGNTLVVTLPEEDLKATNRVLLDCKPWAKIFYADGGKDINVPSNSALDHIHNVVAEREYQRGYKQAKEEYDHKLTEIKSRFKDHYYKKGYEQGRADAAPKWIPFTADTMPKEDGEYFVLYDDKYAEDYDTGSVGVADFYVDCEAFGYWQSYYDPVTLGYVDSDFIEIKVKKWMPIPKDEEGKDDND